MWFGLNWFILVLIISVEHIGISTAKEFYQLAPHILLLVYILYLDAAFGHEVLNQRIAVVLTDSTQFAENLVGKKVDSLFKVPELLSL